MITYLRENNLKEKLIDEILVIDVMVFEVYMHRTGKRISFLHTLALLKEKNFYKSESF